MPNPTPPDVLADPRDRLIVALDFPSAAAAFHLVDRLEGQCLWFKVGLELYLAAGGTIVTALRERGYNVFLDLKLHDIPHTVAAAVRSIRSLGANLLTIHAAGGAEMMIAAAQAVQTPGAPQLLAVTVLTSMNASQMNACGIAGTPATQVLRLAQSAHAAGITGLICSPEEVLALRRNLPAETLLIVPGVRPAGSATGDQKRTATPAMAIAAGASKLVLGRPITQAAHPAAAVHAVLDEIAVALGQSHPL